VGVSRWAGKLSKAKKKIKKETGWGRGENKITKKKAEIRAEKGKILKVNLGRHRDRKENPISAPFIYVGALVAAGSLWPPIFKLGVPEAKERGLWSCSHTDILVR